MWVRREMLGVTSMYSTLSCTSQWKTLRKVSSVNIATKPMLNSSRKMVSARHVSMMALLRRSLMRSSSTSRSVPRKTCARGVRRRRALAGWLGAAAEAGCGQPGRARRGALPALVPAGAPAP